MSKITESQRFLVRDIELVLSLSFREWCEDHKLSEDDKLSATEFIHEYGKEYAEWCKLLHR